MHCIQHSKHMFKHADCLLSFCAENGLWFQIEGVWIDKFFNKRVTVKLLFFHFSNFFICYLDSIISSTTFYLIASAYFSFRFRLERITFSIICFLSRVDCSTRFEKMSTVLLMCYLMAIPKISLYLGLGVRSSNETAALLISCIRSETSRSFSSSTLAMISFSPIIFTSKPSNLSFKSLK